MPTARRLPPWSSATVRSPGDELMAGAVLGADPGRAPCAASRCASLSGNSSSLRDMGGDSMGQCAPVTQQYLFGE